MKKPRGAKLDAEKRSEYLSEVGRAETWDTSSWPSWVVTGRVLPERCLVSIPAKTARAIGAGGRSSVRLQVTQSHISAICAFESGNPSIFEIADFVRTAIAFSVDYIAFHNRGAYEVVLDLCINDRTGETQTIPIFEPTFETADPGLVFSAQQDRWEGGMPLAQAKVFQFPTALHDLTAAVRYPRRTFEYCRMAAEVVRSYFDPPNVRGHTERWIKGEEAMCSALRLTRKSLTSLDSVAARSRHGELITSMNWEMRKRALEFTWEVVARFEAHLRGEANDHWKVLDVQIED